MGLLYKRKEEGSWPSHKELNFLSKKREEGGATIIKPKKIEKERKKLSASVTQEG